jgi:hypothetical protein
MNKGDFNKVVQEIPTFVPIFEVTKVPSWASAYVDKGDEVMYNHRIDTFKTLGSNPMNVGLRPTYVKFVEYRQI